MLGGLGFRSLGFWGLGGRGVGDGSWGMRALSRIEDHEEGQPWLLNQLQALISWV